MRKLSLLAAVVLLSSAWVLAQNSTPPSSSQPSSVPTAQQPAQSDPAQGAKAESGQSIEGCLAGSAGSFTLTDASGKSYQLSGDTSKLSEHVGHQIRVTGSQEGASATGTAGASTSSSASQPSFTVKKVKMISATCSNK